ncbi:MAG: glycosyltransferase family 4 protein [Propionibacteriaceae bacterium]|nr:glycosyltransferase family 4 protein [Propionibacteriaceae bacterium]
MILPLGQLGVATFARFGWPPARLLPFMYSPDEADGAPIHGGSQLPARPIDERLKLVYVGRFTRYTKGTDLLMSALDKLEDDRWTLDLVGGYGDLRDSTISWAEAHPQVRFCGSWTDAEMAANLPRYDVAVVPSRFDGWNVTVNEAIRAGIGTIASDETVSHELIHSSGAGMVIRAGSAGELQRAIEHAVLNPQEVANWKRAAQSFASCISSESVGGYLEGVLDWHLHRVDDDPPMPPWSGRGSNGHATPPTTVCDGFEGRSL